MYNRQLNKNNELYKSLSRQNEIPVINKFWNLFVRKNLTKQI